MIEEILLHVGPPKTGSTSIQKWLQSMRDDLLAQHIYTPSQENHTCLLRFLGRPIVSPNDDTELTRLDEVLKTGGNPSFLKQQITRVIISSEFLSGLTSSEAQRISSYLNLYTKNLRVFAYVRRPIESYRSAIQELLKKGISYTIAAKTIHSRPQNIYRRFTAAFSTQFVMRPYSLSACENWDVVEDFKYFANLALDTDRPFPHQNTSMCLESGLILDSLSHYKLDPAVRRILNSKVLEISGRKFAIDQSSFLDLQDIFYDDEAFIRSTLGFDLNCSPIDFCDWEGEKQKVLLRIEFKDLLKWACDLTLVESSNHRLKVR